MKTLLVQACPRNGQCWLVACLSCESPKPLYVVRNPSESATLGSHTGAALPTFAGGANAAYAALRVGLLLMEGCGGASLGSPYVFSAAQAICQGGCTPAQPRPRHLQAQLQCTGRAIILHPKSHLL